MNGHKGMERSFEHKQGESVKERENTDQQDEERSSTEKDGSIEGEKKDKKGKNKEDEKTLNGIPQDRGYSWVICFCCFSCNAILFAHNRFLSTLIIDIKDEFDETLSIATLVLSAISLSMAVSSIITSNIIIRLFPIRRVCNVAAVCSFASILLAYFSPNIIVYIIAYICRGMFCGCLLIIPISLIGRYFKNRRALASSIASLGIVTSNIVSPQLAVYLRQLYGFRGALLIMAGVELQFLPISMLMRPHTYYTKAFERKQKTMRDTTDDVKKHVLYTQVSLKDVVSVEVETVEKDDEKIQNGRHHFQKVGESQTSRDRGCPETRHKRARDNNLYSTSAPAGFEFVSDDTVKLSSSPLEELKVEDDDDNSSNMKGITINSNDNNDIDIEELDINSGGDRPLLPMRMLSYQEKSTSGSGKMNGKICNDVTRNEVLDTLHLSTPRRQKSGESDIYSSQMSIAAWSSVMDVSCVVVEDRKNEADDNNIDNDDEDVKETKRKRPSVRELCHLNTFFDLKLMRTWMCRWIICFMTIAAPCNLLTMYVPVMAHTAGLSRKEGSLLLTIGASTELFTRPLVGWFADKRIVSKRVLMIGGLSVVVILTQFGRFYNTFEAYAVFTIAVCIFAGFRQNLYHALVFDTFGTEKAPRVIGLIVPCITVFLSINHPIVGAMVDSTGSFVIPLHYFGCCIAVGIILLLLKPVFYRWDKNNEIAFNEHTDRHADNVKKQQKP